MSFSLAGFVVLLLLMLSFNLGAQQRTLEEFKEEILKRFEEMKSPIKPEIKIEGRKGVVDRLRSLDRDHWATKLRNVSEVYRYPTPNSPRKKEAFQRSLRAFLEAARFFDPLLERVKIPFLPPLRE